MIFPGLVFGNHAKNPEVWMCVSPLPNSEKVIPLPNFKKVFSLVDSSQDWSYVKTHITGIKFYIDMIRKNSKKDLSSLADMCKKNNLKVAIECGGTLSPLWGNSAGEKSAEIELEVIDKWCDAGGTVDFLDLDGPVRRLLDLNNDCIRNDSNSFTSIEKCAEELIDYIKSIKKSHPKIRFFLLTNFPNWGYRGGVSYHGTSPDRQQLGDYYEVIKIVLEKVKAADLSFAGITIDNPYEYLIGKHNSITWKDPSHLNWLKRVRMFEDFCHESDVPFNLIINSETGGGSSDKMFYDRTLKMLETYIQAGGNPERYIIQSWYNFPKETVPENKPYTMTYLVKEVLMRLDKNIKKQKGNKMKTIETDYLTYLPDNYQEFKNDWPLILFLHGAGERGDEIKKVEANGLPMLIAKKDKKFPFVIVAPQCPENDWWSSETQINLLNNLLDDIVAKYKIDKDRIYLTGLSMGGFGTWQLACDYPDRFAAIAPICGKGSPEKAEKIKNIPIWVFHGQKDTIVPFKNSEEMVEALEKVGGNVKFTVYPEAGHDSWTETYNNPELYKWFLKHRREEN